MRRSFFICAILTLGAARVLAQAFVNPDNFATGVAVTVSDPAIQNGTPIKIGNLATAAGFVGVGLGQVKIEMFAAPQGTPLDVLEAGSPLATTFNSIVPFVGTQGTFNFQNPFELPTEPGFDGSAPVEFIFLASGGGYFGWSQEGLITPESVAQMNSGQIPLHVFGTDAGQIEQFAMTPIPDSTSTIALCGISAMALLNFRHRKR